MLITMNVLKQVLVILILVLISVPLAACGVTTPVPISTATALPSLTPSVMSTHTEPPPTPSSTSTSSAIPISSPPDGLRMAYVIDGNLYFQDGSKPPLQLTNSGEDSSPIFSDDGEKIAFNRGKKDRLDIYFINVDGSDEQAIVTTSQLMNLNIGYDNSTAAYFKSFLPRTHNLLFSTYQLLEGGTVIYNGDLLIVDTDIAKIKRLSNYGSDFYVSPDGKFIAIDAIGRIDVIDIDGNVVHNNLLTYTPSEPVFLPPGVFWMSDSTGLIFLLPIPTSYESNYPPDYTVWRYMLDSSRGIQVSFDPLPMEVYMAEVSPDGNWIIYNREDQNAFFLGDIRTGHAKLYEPQPFIGHYDSSWSSDNGHFVYSTPPGRTLYLGSVDGPPELIGEGDFQGWIDANRFLYYAYRDKNIVLGDIKGSKKIIFIDHESFKNPGVFTFIFPKTPSSAAFSK